MKEIHLLGCTQFTALKSIIQPTLAVEALSISGTQLSFIPPLPHLLKRLDLSHSPGLTTEKSIGNIT